MLYLLPEAAVLSVGFRTNSPFTRRVETKMNQNLLKDRRFWPLFWTQFLGAFNDNVFKNALVILITIRAFTMGGVSSKQMVALCGGIFILPFFLFSATAGQMADKYSKSKLIFWIKVWEILVMLLGAYGFIVGNISLLLVTLFLMGLQSSFFGPVKYSVLPQLLREEELVSGNAYVEMGTFVSILLGTILGGVLIAIPEFGSQLVSGAVILLAVLGCLASVRMPYLAPAAPELKFNANPLRPTFEIVRLTGKTRSVFLSILGISWFWFLGAAFLSLLPPYCKEFLNAEESVITFFLVLFSLGVGVGSLLCERLSFRKLELGLVPVGSIGLSLFSFDLFLVGRPDALMGNAGDILSVTALLSAPGGWRIASDFLLFSISGGLFIVPLYTLIQQRSNRAERSRVIAGNNILNAFFMVVSAVLLVILFALNFTIPQVFLIFSLLNLLVAVYIYTVIPEFLFRFLCWILANIVYRLKVVGRENIPLEGPVVLVCNHVSFVDWLIISSASPRPIRFVMHYSFLEVPFTRRIFKDTGVIPIAGSRENPEILDAAFEKIAENLEAGEAVCIFPEGKITKDGKMNPFRPGVERVIRTTPVPVVPMALDGLWGSFFSRKYGKAMTKPFRRIRSRIRLVIGQAIPPEEVSAERLYKLVSGLKSDESGDSHCLEDQGKEDVTPEPLEACSPALSEDSNDGKI